MFDHCLSFLIRCVSFYPIYVGFYVIYMVFHARNEPKGGGGAPMEERGFEMSSIPGFQNLPIYYLICLDNQWSFEIKFEIKFQPRANLLDRRPYKKSSSTAVLMDFPDCVCLSLIAAVVLIVFNAR